MQNTREHQRWQIALAAILIQLCLGTVYAWSVFKNELVANHGWDEMATSITFMICIGAIGIAAGFGGILVDKVGPKLVAFLSGIFFGFGTILGGYGIARENIFLLYLGYGVIGGIANGFGYVTPIATLIRWFPDKKGLVTGLAVMGFGAGAFFMGEIAPVQITQFGVAKTLYFWGVIFFLLITGAAMFFSTPPAGWVPAHYHPPVEKIAPYEASLRQALRTPTWWILWTMLFLNISAGIGLISQLSPMAKELYQLVLGPEASPQQYLASLDAAGGFVVAVASIFNGIGRLFWAWLSDIWGRRLTFSVLLLSEAGVYFLLPQIRDYYVFLALSCYLLACYGGGFATMPAFVADTFGSKNIGRVYGTMLTAWGLAGVTGPLVFAYVKKATGDFYIALYIGTGLLLIGFILNCFYRRPNSSPNLFFAHSPQ